MKHLKIISILSIMFALSAANAETTVNGEIWADFDVVLDNGEVGTDDSITPMGAEINRARVNIMHKFNENWSATLRVEGSDTAGTTVVTIDDQGTTGDTSDDTVSATTTTSIVKRAHIDAKDWVADGTHLRIGKQNNAYRAAFDKHHNKWLHRDLTSEFSEVLVAAYGLSGDANFENYTGIFLNWMVNDMWNVGITVNNGPTEQLVNGGNGGISHDVNGYALTVEGTFNDNFGMILSHDTYGSGSIGTSDVAANETVDGFTATRVTFLYMSDMIDASLEYAMWSHEEAVANGTDGEDTSAFGLSLDYKMDANFVHVYYAMTSDFDASTAADNVTVDNGLDSTYRVGYVWGLDEGLQTGLFYTATTRDVVAAAPDADESLIEWKWVANF